MYAIWKTSAITAIFSLFVTVSAPLILNWINSGKLQYEYSFSHFDRSAAILTIKIENNSSKIEKNIYITIPNSVISEEKDIHMSTSISDVSMKKIGKKIEIKIPQLRQKEKGKIKLLFIGDYYFTDYEVTNLDVSSESTIGSEIHYLFRDNHAYDTYSIFSIIMFLSLAFWVLIFNIDYQLSPYKRKKELLISHLKNLAEQHNEDITINYRNDNKPS